MVNTRRVCLEQPPLHSLPPSLPLRSDLCGVQRDYTATADWTALQPYRRASDGVPKAYPPGALSQ